MSASQDKKKRQFEREQGIEKHQLAEKKTREKWSKTKRNYTIVGIIVVVLAAAIILVSSNLFYTGTTAVKIGNQKYNTAEYTYYYKTGYYNFMSSNAYAAYIIDTSKPLDEQTYIGDSSMTWDDYFKDLALNSMKQMTALYEAAVADGFTLSQDAMDNIDASIANLSSEATAGGYPSVKAYLGAAYGKGCSEKLMRSIVEQSALASEYAESIYNSFTYDEDTLETYYQEHKDELDHIDYAYYFVSGAADEENGIDAETAMAEAKEKAEKIKDKTTDADSLIAAAMEIDEGTATSTISTGATVAGYDFGEWLLNADRQPGNAEVIESETGYYIVVFTERNDNHYNTATVRHSLIEAERDENGVYTDEAKAEAEAKAEEILAEWKAGEATEESFAALANEKSADAGSNTNGGLYENIFRHAMVDEFDAFCFAPHEHGETDIVYGESSQYAGYHIMYYVGEGGLYSDYVAESELRSADYNAWETALLENYTVETKFPIRFSR